jgi:hypothetical protein
MNTVEEVVELIKGMPDEIQAEVRDFARFLRESRKPLMPPDLDGQLAAMACDPQIQAEIREIECEFAVAESDGLKPY